MRGETNMSELTFYYLLQWWKLSWNVLQDQLEKVIHHHLIRSNKTNRKKCFSEPITYQCFLLCFQCMLRTKVKCWELKKNLRSAKGNFSFTVITKRFCDLMVLPDPNFQDMSHFLGQEIMPKVVICLFLANKTLN